jgi:DNA-binding NarL/FixJ family response regulator
MQLTELLRGKASASNVPIVVLTGSGGSREWQHLSKLGADGFLVKPAHGQDIATLLRRVLADRVRETPLLSSRRELAPHEAETVRQGPEPVSMEVEAATPVLTSKKAS